MRKILIIFILAIITGCRTNNGDIGPMYGQWILEQLTVDGEPDDIVCSDYSFSFHNNIILIIHQTGNYQYSESYGTWALDGDKLTLNFTHTADTYPANVIKFNPPMALHIPGRTITIMNVNQLTDKRLRFGFIDNEGKTYTYSFFKLR